MNELVINIANRTFSYICNDCERYVDKSYYDFTDSEDRVRIVIVRNWTEEIEFIKSNLDLIRFVR